MKLIKFCFSLCVSLNFSILRVKVNKNSCSLFLTFAGVLMHSHGVESKIFLYIRDWNCHRIVLVAWLKGWKPMLGFVFHFVRATDRQCLYILNILNLYHFFRLEFQLFFNSNEYRNIVNNFLF